MRVGLIGKRELNRLNVLARLSSKTDRCSCGRRSSNIRWSDDVHDQATVLVRNVPRPSIFTAGPSSAGCRASSSPEPAYGHGDDRKVTMKGLRSRDGTRIIRPSGPSGVRGFASFLAHALHSPFTDLLGSSTCLALGPDIL